MAEAEEKTTKRGNPNFGNKLGKKAASKWDHKKRYHFQLINTYESAKPRDLKTGQMLDNPFPPVYIALNEGVGYNEERGEVENWRYVYGYSSIWVKDQVSPEPTKQQLENPQNHIIFRNGSLRVNGNNTALLDALTVQDVFKGVKEPINETPAIFYLVNEDEQRQKMRTDADKAFEAEKAARECDLADMLPVAMFFGIDVQNPEEDEDRIRTEFIFKAKQFPDAFLKQFVNPLNKYKFNFAMALRDNTISASVYPGKIVLTDTNKVICDVKEGDAAEQLASMVIQGDRAVVSLYEQLEKLALAE
jgi:hypothetical protein